MAANPTSVSNMALSHLGIGSAISNVVSDVSAEAKACRVFYDDALYATLKDYRWPWAKKYAALALVETDPDNGWGFSYRQPTDCLDVRYVELAGANDPGVLNAKQSPFDVGHDGSGLLIYSDIEEAVLCYTPKISNYNLFTSNFLLALSFRLAAYVAPRLTKGDPFKLGPRAMQMYMMEIAKASANSFNETKPAPSPDSDMINAR